MDPLAATANKQTFRTDLDGVADSARHLKEDLVGLAKGVNNAAHSGAAAAMEQAHHGVDGAKERGQHANDYVLNLIKTQPLAAVGIAAGVGLLAGMILFGRK